jgi:hypothetical protein
MRDGLDVFGSFDYFFTLGIQIEILWLQKNCLEFIANFSRILAEETRENLGPFSNQQIHFLFPKFKNLWALFFQFSFDFPFFRRSRTIFSEHFQRLFPFVVMVLSRRKSCAKPCSTTTGRPSTWTQSRWCSRCSIVTWMVSKRKTVVVLC